jgi:hypothetical protein
MMISWLLLAAALVFETGQRRLPYPCFSRETLRDLTSGLEGVSE